MSRDHFTRHYHLYGLGLNFWTNYSAELLAGLHSRLAAFPLNGSGSGDLNFEFWGVAAGEDHQVKKPLVRGRPVYDPPLGEVLYLDEGDQFYIDYGDRVRVLCLPEQGQARLSLRQAQPDNRWLATHPLFTLSLVELLKRRGLYHLHAAGLALEGQGLLLAGSSGAGKSTLALALVRAGFDFMGDDTLFLAPGPAGLKLLAFPDEVDLTGETARLFPELHYLLDRPLPPGRAKRQMRVEEVYPVKTVMECQPAILVFPRIARTERSCLEPMSRSEALLELAPNILLTEVRSSQAHLDALAELVRHSRCYRLKTGRDFDDLARRLREI